MNNTVLAAAAVISLLDPDLEERGYCVVAPEEQEELLDASQRAAKAEEERRLAAKRTHNKQVRARRRKQQRKEAAGLGHKLGSGNRACKWCQAPRVTILETSRRCTE